MTTIHPSDDPIGLSPAEQSTLTMADATCSALFGTSTVTETAHSIMQDAKRMTSASPATLKEWSGSLCPIDPANFWIDDETGERVNAKTGERTRVAQDANLNGYDYKHQAWVVNGRYVACGHLQTTPCECYGRIHEGESPAPDADVQ